MFLNGLLFAGNVIYGLGQRLSQDTAARSAKVMSDCFEAFGEATSEHTAVIALCWNEAGSEAEAKGKQSATTASPEKGGSKVFELSQRGAAWPRGRPNEEAQCLCDIGVATAMNLVCS